MDQKKYFSEFIKCEVCECEDHKIVREIVSISRGNYGKLPVVSCKKCGFLFQNPRLNEQFYEDYYKKNYRNLLFKRSEPSEDFINDQLLRGKKLFEFIRKFIPKKGKILDVGCSVGCMLIPFIKYGWEAFGTDLDTDFVKFGKERLGLPLEDVKAENMILEENSYDLIIIMGSLEHIYDPNKTLEICKKAAKNNSLIILEGRGEPQSHTRDYFNQNHHRYFSLVSIELMMMKHGWKPFLTTDAMIHGPTRPGAFTSVGKLEKQFKKEDFKKILKKHKENYEEVIKKLDNHDRKFEL